MTRIFPTGPRKKRLHVFEKCMQLACVSERPGEWNLKTFDIGSLIINIL